MLYNKCTQYGENWCVMIKVFRNISIEIREEYLHQDQVVVEEVICQDCYQIKSLNIEPKVIVDVGAHIGAFSLLAHQLFPKAKIIAIECCPENISILCNNISKFADVIQAAMTYETNLALLNSVFPNCAATGGSIVCSPEQLQNYNPNLYKPDVRPIKRITIEDLNLEKIDLLKLDCEGSELSILEQTTSLDKLNTIVGEYHGKERFINIINNRFSGWNFKILKDGNLGLFSLVKERV